MGKRQFTTPWIFATMIAVLGILAPIAWERYNSRSRLEIQHISSAVLIEKTTRLDKLKLQYDGRDITSLRILQFLLINSGRRSIRKEDVLRSPILQFDEKADILDARLDATFPPDLQPTITQSPSNRTVSVACPLLNPGDKILFTVFVTGETPEISAKARIVGVRSLIFVDRVAELKEPPRRIPWTVYLVGFFTLMFFLLFGVAHREVRKHKRLVKLYLTDNNPFPNCRTKDEYADFVKTTFSYMTPSERKRGLDAVHAEEDPLSKKAQAQIESKIRDMLGQQIASHSARVGMLIMAALGLWYVLARVL